MAEIHDMSALEQGEAVKRHDVSPVELVHHYLSRIESLSSEMGAFVTVTADMALESARNAEDTAMSRTDLPVLFGVPVAIKDLNFTAGVLTMFGSAVMRDFVSPMDDHVVTRIKQAGMISLGKTNVPEFGLPCYTEPDVAPPARSPHDPSRSAGGSSGGAAAAVAAGLVPVAQGNDGAGSVRIPASVCGLVGLKTSRGRVSNGPVLPDTNGLAANGPLARTVADAAALLDVMAGPMAGDPWWAPPLPEGETFLSYARRMPGKLRIGRYVEPVVPGAVVDAECMAAYDETSSLLEELGHEVLECPLPFSPELIPQFETIWVVGAASIPVAPADEEKLRPLTRWLRERGRFVSATEYLAALGAAQMAARAAVGATASYDVVMTPTLARLPALVGSFRDDVHPELDFEAQKQFTPFTATYNMTGQPAISLPLHWTSEGLPVGVQLVGSPAGEGLLLSLAAQLEQARPWSSHLPACW
ncbi:MAG: amidase [Acidimicrobiales bacterium]